MHNIYLYDISYRYINDIGKQIAYEYNCGDDFLRFVGKRAFISEDMRGEIQRKREIFHQFVKNIQELITLFGNIVAVSQQTIQ